MSTIAYRSHRHRRVFNAKLHFRSVNENKTFAQKQPLSPLKTCTCSIFLENPFLFYIFFCFVVVFVFCAGRTASRVRAQAQRAGAAGFLAPLLLFLYKFFIFIFALFSANRSSLCQQENNPMIHVSAR